MSSDDCVMCRRPLLGTRFGWRENAKSGERVHSGCLLFAKEHGDTPGKAWARSTSWGRIVLDTDAAGEPT